MILLQYANVVWGQILMLTPPSFPGFQVVQTPDISDLLDL
jgi:hypothetical protein